MYFLCVDFCNSVHLQFIPSLDSAPAQSPITAVLEELLKVAKSNEEAVKDVRFNVGEIPKKKLETYDASDIQTNVRELYFDLDNATDNMFFSRLV